MEIKKCYLIIDIKRITDNQRALSSYQIPCLLDVNISDPIFNPATSSF